MFSTIRDHVLKSFAGRVPLHEIFLFPGPTTDYDACVFYESDADIEACRINGAEQALKDAILQGFAAIKNDSGVSPTVAFKFDSHEKVKKRCNGKTLLYGVKSNSQFSYDFTL